MAHFDLSQIARKPFNQKEVQIENLIPGDFFLRGRMNVSRVAESFKEGARSEADPGIPGALTQRADAPRRAWACVL